MEIVLDKFTSNSIKEEKKLVNVSYKFKDNCISFCYGTSGALIKDLLLQKKTKSSGTIKMVPEGSVSDIGYVGNNPSKEFNKKKVQEEFEYINNEFNMGYDSVIPRAIQSLVMVGLNERYLDRNFVNMSLSEQKKVSLALVLFYNPKIIFFDYFEKGLNFKDIDYFKKLMKILKAKYKKNIVIFSDDIEKYMDVLDNYVIFNDGKVVLLGSSKDLYNQELYKYIECPRIISFVKKVRDNNIELLNYIEVKELIKAIYRDVENK